MADKIKVGIIGLGFMGSTHFRIYKQNNKAEIAAVADVNPAKIKGNWSSIVANIGDSDNSVPVDMAGIRTYTDGMDLINDTGIDMVDVCVPTFLHKKYIIAALKAGKHVLCEKPIGRNLSDAKEITTEAEKSEKFFMTAMCIRFWPEYSHAYELYRSGKLGKLVSATFKRTSPSVHGNSWEDWFMKSELSGGALLDLHLHDTDAVRYFFGRPDSVTAFGVKGFRTDRGIDHAVTRYDYGDGTLIMSEGGWESAKAAPFEMSFQIVCEKGTARLSELGYKIIYEDGSIDEPKPAKPGMPTGWHVEIDYFLSCVLKGKKPDNYITLEEMRDSMAIIEAEEKSINENRTIVVEY